MRVLVVTAVAAEASSVARGLPASATRTTRPLPTGSVLTSHALTGGVVIDVVDAGVGPAAAAVGAATALAAAPHPYGLVISAGIGGGFVPRAPLGTLVVSDAIVAADLGAETPEGYLAVERLGFGRSVHVPPPALVRALADAVRHGTRPPVCLVAPVLTVSTVTGTAARAAELAARHPGAGAEAMEGFGVAEAAAAHGVPAVELRAVSNAVGPRDRAAWRIGEALDGLSAAFEALSASFPFPDLLEDRAP
ncbi:futalosine hydrolase [Streptomyces sp. MUM 203J]|uniref:futalosine hydrolase n=1 Tax=Streptomyces sp. MUM 203J TaxID=2791990 RepID=UPI001F0361B5|nr:futalosine hydrolase [Streptomyces sp. MUM 203J]MCH0538660.1 futalosine hydrolase [Streptomyces sp. MUM 203J]